MVWRRVRTPGLLLVVASCGGAPARPAPAPTPRAPAAASAPTPLAADRDGDGAGDSEDACPDDPEDCDGYQDEDGCPDPDNDGDGIPDVCDACPDEAGTPGTDGCPHRVIILEDQIQIVPQILFPAGSARPVRDSRPVLEEIARLMKDHAEIKVVGVVGHADRGEPRPLELGQRRADAVVRALQDLGVAASRLEAHSAGSTRPIADPHGSERARNRRVEFALVRRGGEQIMRWTASGYEAVDVAPAPAAAPGPPHCEPGASLPPALHQRCAGRHHVAPGR